MNPTHCRRCGALVLDEGAHRAFHEHIDAYLFELSTRCLICGAVIASHFATDHIDMHEARGEWVDPEGRAP